MKFLETGIIHGEVKRLVKASKRLNFAVAFWGDGATKRLGLDRLSGKQVKIICNLALGGTNPKEIRRIRKRLSGSKNGSDIRQHDRLHAKMYLFDSVVIVGSANASANGLAFEGKEANGFSEAALETEDKEVVYSAEKWFEHLWKMSTAIEEEDLSRAEQRWRRRRGCISDRDRSSRDFRVIWWSGKATKKQTDRAEKFKKLHSLGKTWDWFVEEGASDGEIAQWYKPDSLAFCFSIGNNGSVNFEGLALFPPGTLLRHKHRDETYVHCQYFRKPLEKLPRSVRAWSGFAELNTKDRRDSMSAGVRREVRNGNTDGALSLSRLIE